MPAQMNLVEILLPVRDNAGVAFPKSSFERVKDELTGRFGGLTAFTRSPADGFWQDKSGATHAEDVIAFEVMAESVDEGWWEELPQQAGNPVRPGGDRHPRARDTAAVTRGRP